VEHISFSSWKALEVPGGSTAIGTRWFERRPTRDDTQRWLLDLQTDGSYQISNKAMGGALVNTSPSASACTSATACQLLQSSWQAVDQQRWRIQ
jgi:hypothetical protein